MAKGKTLGFFLLAFVVFAADAFTKKLVAETLTFGESIEVTPFLNIVLALNDGAAFSFLADSGGWQHWIFCAVAMGAAAVCAWWIWTRKVTGYAACGLSLILAGALGNLADRLRIGAVIDFLDFHAFGWHWPAFNVADTAICVGAFLFALYCLFTKDS